MGLALAGAPRVLLLDEPLAGLAAAERERVGDLIKRISADLPVLLVEHDIDRVFALADRVTVMNEGKVLVDGTADDARESQAVREVYIGSGTAALAARPRGQAERAERPAHPRPRAGRCVLRQESHRDGSVAQGARARDRGAARAQRRGQVDAAEDDRRDRHRRKAAASCSRATISRGVPPRPMRAAASAMCRRVAVSLPG